jgi:peptidoglycan/LPS O-acetylase OafA/YrhL
VNSGGRVFHSLDALRGLAALGVVMFHGRAFFAPVSVPGGYLAVDLFFLMSGFVIARAYEERFYSGMSVWEFMRIRLTRLYPLYALGTILGLLAIIASLNGNNIDHWTGQTLALMAAFSVVMLPNFAGYLLGATGWGQYDRLFPIDVPCWSLFLEIAVNLAYGLLWRHLTTRSLVIISACSALGVLVWLPGNGSIDMGYTVQTLGPGLIRTIFGFSVGVLIARRSTVITPQENTALFLAICAAFTIAIAVAPANRVVWDAVSAMLLFPVIVYAATLIDPPASLRPAATFLGVTSYAVYALHVPLLSVANSVFRARLATTQSPLYLGLILLAVLLFACWLIDRYYDFPLRRLLSRAWRPKARVGQPPLPTRS